MITVAEVPEYIRRAEKLLTEVERQDLVSYLAVPSKGGRSDCRHRRCPEVTVVQKRAWQERVGCG